MFSKTIKNMKEEVPEIQEATTNDIKLEEQTEKLEDSDFQEYYIMYMKLMELVTQKMTPLNKEEVLKAKITQTNTNDTATDEAKILYRKLKSAKNEDAKIFALMYKMAYKENKQDIKESDWREQFDKIELKQPKEAVRIEKVHGSSKRKLSELSRIQKQLNGIVQKNASPLALLALGIMYRVRNCELYRHDRPYGLDYPDKHKAISCFALAVMLSLHEGKTSNFILTEARKQFILAASFWGELKIRANDVGKRVSLYGKLFNFNFNEYSNRYGDEKKECEKHILKTEASDDSLIDFMVKKLKLRQSTIAIVLDKLAELRKPAMESLIEKYESKSLSKTFKYKFKI